jgi:prepilin-type N-terminal cleavage/methylation domain-containing protein
MSRFRNTVERVGDERGFTLIELMVVMVTGVLVTSALFTILDVTLRQTTRTFSRVDATQRARTAVETIEQEMHSSCIANDAAPIIDGSNANSVSFWSQYGKAASPVPVKHTIAFNSSAGTLVDSTYPVTPADDFTPPWTASGTPTRVNTLLKNVAQSGSTPVFQYFSLSSNGTTNISSAVSSPLTTTTAPKVSEVRITLLVKPAGGSQQNINLVHNTVTDSVLLRLTPVSNPDGVAQEFAPCE